MLILLLLHLVHRSTGGSFVQCYYSSCSPPVQHVMIYSDFEAQGDHRLRLLFVDIHLRVALISKLREDF